MYPLNDEWLVWIVTEAFLVNVCQMNKHYTDYTEEELLKRIQNI